MPKSPLFLVWVALAMACNSPASQNPASASAQGTPVTAARPAPSPAKAASKKPAVRRDLTRDLPESGTSFYGVYLNGHKVGWMRSRLEVGDQVVMVLNLEAAVGGLGTVSKISLEETRTYNAKTGALVALSFAQQAATGATRVVGDVIAGELVLSITAGNKTSRQKVVVQETLEDALASVRLAAAGKIGAVKKTRRFDAAILKQVEIEHQAVAIEERLLGGVATRTVKIESRYPTLEIVETSWLDEGGKVLESKVGGFFVARLEPPDVAKRLDYSQDLLVSAVVAPPAGMAGAVEREKIELVFTGFGTTQVPVSRRQQVRRRGAQVRLVLTRDTPPQGPFPPPPNPTDPDLLSTPFIQSDSRAIVREAKAAVGDATTLAEAVQRLTRFVFDHVRDEYVPAYSNALEALNSGRGDCTEHSILFVAMARALGIPARVAVGIAYWPAGGGFGWHAWAEIKDGDRWLSVDPTWNQPVADVTHVKLAAGGPAEQARIVMLLGQLRITDASW